MLLLDNQVLVPLPRGALAQLRLVHQLCLYLSQSDLTMVMYALVTSRLDYCSIYYVALPLMTIQKLQLVQNATAHVTKPRWFAAGRTLLFQLH